MEEVKEERRSVPQNNQIENLERRDTFGKEKGRIDRNSGKTPNFGIVPVS